jgi:hypothetical protein
VSESELGLQRAAAGVLQLLGAADLGNREVSEAGSQAQPEASYVAAEGRVARRGHCSEGPGLWACL